MGLARCVATLALDREAPAPHNPRRGAPDDRRLVDVRQRAALETMSSSVTGPAGGGRQLSSTTAGFVPAHGLPFGSRASGGPTDRADTRGAQRHDLPESRRIDGRRPPEAARR
jgi:hypothetical protein